MRITVYCSSSSHLADIYFKKTRELAQLFLVENAHVIYGGGSVGLMGCMADEYIKSQGKITGVIPQFMVDVEWAHPGVSDMIITKTMHERISKFKELADAIVVLPGGTGTFEELFEALTMKRLGKFLKPIVVLNINGYFDPLRKQLQKSFDESFMHKSYKEMYSIVDKPEKVLPAIRNANSWSPNAIDNATYK